MYLLYLFALIVCLLLLLTLLYLLLFCFVFLNGNQWRLMSVLLLFFLMYASWQYHGCQNVLAYLQYGCDYSIGPVSLEG